MIVLIIVIVIKNIENQIWNIKKKLKGDKIEKEFQFYKLFQIKKIIKKTWIKYKRVTNWKVVLKS
jgi:hypothetical protein